METNIINMHMHIKSLTAKGIPESAAEELVDLIIETQNKSSETLDSKLDQINRKLDQCVTKEDAKSFVTKDYLDAKLNRLKYEMVVWLIGAVATIIGGLKLF